MLDNFFAIFKRLSKDSFHSIHFKSLENCVLFSEEILRNIPISNIKMILISISEKFWKRSSSSIESSEERKWYKSTIDAPLIDVSRNVYLFIFHPSLSSSARRGNTDFGRGIYKANTVTGGGGGSGGVGSTADPLCRAVAKPLRVWW